MNSAIAVVALWGAVSPQISELSLRWEQDYRHARAIGTREHKPLAVFVGTGAGGWQHLAREGNLDLASRRTLRQHFVPVYVNQDTDAGRQLAANFGLAGKTGLVISDRTGGVMAFRHEGDLPAAELVRQLERYADPNLVVSTTEGNAGQQVYLAQAQPAAYPAYQPAQAYIPPSYYQNPYGNPFACQT